MKFEDIDFSPLAKLAKPKLIPAAYVYVFTHRALYIGTVAFAIIGFVLNLLYDRNGNKVVADIFGYGFLFAVLLFNFYVVYSYTKLRKRYWKEFATLNGWNKVLHSKKFVPPSIANYGIRERSFDSSIKTEHWVITPHRYETSGGRHSRTIINTVFSTELPKAMPYIAIDSVKNFGGLVHAPEGFEVVELEGDVKKYFIIYVQKGLYTDALSILSPDILAVLVDKCRDYDIEIVDNMLYILAASDVRTMKRMQKMYAASEALRSELLHRAKSLNYQAGKNFEYRGREHKAITKYNASYKRSIILEIKRASFFLKILAIILLGIFVSMYANYIMS